MTKKVKVQVKCPKCKTTGGVIGRIDAYHDFRLYIKPEQTKVSWVEDGVVDMGDPIYECFKCHSELNRKSLEKFNNILL